MKPIISAISLAMLSTVSYQTLASEVIQYPAALVCGEQLPNGTPNTRVPKYPNRESFSISNGSLYVRVSAYVDCAIPYQQGRYIEKVSLDISGNGVELRSCSVIAQRIGSNTGYGQAQTMPKAVTTEYSHTDIGVQGDGSIIHFYCTTSNQTNSSYDGYTRFWTATIQYADQ